MAEGRPRARPTARTSEEKTEGFNDALKVDAVGKTADIVMAFNYLAILSAFNDIRVYGALDQESRIDPPGLLFENPDKGLSDPFAFHFGVQDILHFLEETVSCVHKDQGDPVFLIKHPADHGRFILAHEAVIDKDTGQLIADRAVDQKGSDGGIDTA